MAHAVETMMYVGQEPWHGLGHRFIDPPPTVDAAIMAAGLNWKAVLRDLHTLDGSGKPEHKVDSRAVIRDTDNSVLGVVGSRFTPLQNAEAFKVFQPFLDEGLATFETAGSLHSGRKVWVLAKVKAKPAVIANGDEVLKYVLLSHGHDGSTAINIGTTPIRVVCANTLALADGHSGSVLSRILHTKSAKETLDAAVAVIKAVDDAVEGSAELYRQLAKKRVTKSELELYLKKFLDLEEETKSIAELTGKTGTKARRLLELFEAGQGNDLKSIRGSWWAAYNGISQFLTYEAGRSADTRLDSLWFGPGANSNIYALDLAAEMAGLAVAA